MARLALSLCLAIAIGVPAAAHSAVPRREGQNVLRSVVRAGIPGVVAYVKDRHGVWSGTNGFASLATETPIRPNFHFRAASVTKTFTATIVLQLVRDGKVRLEDTVERWLPGILDNGASVTVEQLLRHSSGIPDFDDPSGLLTPREVLRSALAQPTLFPPGTAWSYSNTNYILLGLIVEAASGATFAHELEQRIIKPVGLRQTRFERSPTDTDMPIPFAHGYAREDARAPARDVTALKGHWSSGGIVSTVGDLARFYKALLGGRLLPAHLRARMLETSPADSRAGYDSFGLGIGASRLSCGRVAWGHYGGLPGFRTAVFASRTASRLVVVAINEGSDWTLGPMFRAASRLFCLP